jgi:replicative DNA helicase
LEEAVLGAMLLEKDAVNDVLDILSPDSFYKESHIKIYRTIQEKILPLPDDTVILSGHGEPTNIGTERKLIDAFGARAHDDQLCGDVTWT